MDILNTVSNGAAPTPPAAIHSYTLKRRPSNMPNL